MKIDFSDIDDWREFENLVADYFREIKSYDGNNLIDVQVEQSGGGPDGGRDILLTFNINDSIVSFKRKWLVQCKFYKGDVLKSHFSDQNLTSLIQEYNATGYLLVCKSNVHGGVTTMFENLRKNCKYDLNYEIWNGDHFRHRLTFAESVLETYFPDYFHYKEERKIQLEKLKAGI